MVTTTRWPALNPGAEWKTRTRLKPQEGQRELSDVRRAWDEYLGRFPWEWFCTLTFDEDRANCTRERADREAFEWCNLVGRTLRRPVGWVYAPERSKSGAWHAHALLTGVVERRNLKPLEGCWRLRNGHIHVTPVWDRRGVSLYASKCAAMAGTLVWSDTLGRYVDALRAAPVVALYPTDADHGTTREAHSCPVSR